MTIRNDSDNEDGVSTEIRPFSYYEAQIVQKIHHIYLSTEIGAPALYTDMINIIRSAGPNDIVYIHLNTPGGDLTAGVQIINAMQSTQAHVICGVECEVSSLGTLIFLAADEFVVHDNTIFMFHNFSSMTFGKGHEQAAQLEATTKWFNNLARKLYIPFMSEEEYARIEQGGDLWLDAEEVRERLAYMVERMQEKAEQEKAEQEKAKTTPKKSAHKKRAAKKKVD